MTTRRPAANRTIPPRPSDLEVDGEPGRTRDRAKGQPIGLPEDAGAGEFEPPAWVRDELGGATGRGVRVAVIDSGWDRSIPDPRVLPGVSFVNPADDLAFLRNDDDQDVLGHGTACVDLVLRIAPDAQVIPVKVFGRFLETSPGTLQLALRWAIEAGVDVINVSLGTKLKGTLYPLYLACEVARQRGIIVVAAGDNARKWSYPAIFENVIGVDAAHFDSPYHFRYRPDDAMECVAWGVGQPVLGIGGGRSVRHGTSFAAPNVAGIIALILERHPGATLDQVREMLPRFAVEVVHGTDDEEHDISDVPIPDALRRKGAARPRKPRKPKSAAPSADAAESAPSSNGKQPAGKRKTTRKPAAGKQATAAPVAAKKQKETAKPRKPSVATGSTAVGKAAEKPKRTPKPRTSAKAAPVSAAAAKPKRAATPRASTARKPAPDSSATKPH